MTADRFDLLLCAFVTRHPPTEAQRASLHDYHIVQVDPPMRCFSVRDAWMQTIFACNRAPDLIVLVLHHRWITPFVKHVARLWGFRVRLESVDANDRVMQHWEVTPPAVAHH